MTASLFWELSPGDEEEDSAPVTDFLGLKMPTTVRGTQKERLREQLSDGKWHHQDELYRVGGARFGARIGELRRDDRLVIVQRESPTDHKQLYQLIGPRTPETERWAKEYDQEDRAKPIYFDAASAKQEMVAHALLYLLDPDGYRKSQLGKTYGKLQRIAPAGFDAKAVAQKLVERLS